MKCPIDNTELQMSERQNIEIDYSPTCRGVWLDRGELDKLIEKSSTQTVQSSRPESKRSAHDDSHGSRRYKREKSWLGDIFD